MKPRLLILLFLLLVVGGATAWRIANPLERETVSLESLNSRPAPEFQLLDQNNRPIQLRGYVGRYRVLLYFFDPTAGPDADRVLKRLKDVHGALKKSQVMTFAISTPLNPEQKRQTLSYPFPILRDTLAGQPGSCTFAWGRATLAQGETGPAKITPGAFLVDATGMVNWDGKFPKPVEDPEGLINAILSGEQ
jgi:peroxiredoxin